MSKNKILTSYQIAEEYLKDKIDLSGRPLIEHSLAVAQLVASEYCSRKFEFHDNFICVALLHDVIESCDSMQNRDNAYMAINKKLGKVIAEAVLAITREFQESYQDYIERCKCNPIAKMVKIYDLQHNLDMRRWIYLKLDNNAIRRWRKYRDAYEFLDN